MCAYIAIISVKYRSIPRSGCRTGLEAVVEIRVCFYSFEPLVPALHLLFNICVLRVTVSWGRPLVQTWGASLSPLSRLLQELLTWLSCSKIWNDKWILISSTFKRVDYKVYIGGSPWCLTLLCLSGDLLSWFSLTVWAGFSGETPSTE